MSLFYNKKTSFNVAKKMLRGFFSWWREELLQSVPSIISQKFQSPETTIFAISKEQFIKISCLSKGQTCECEPIPYSGIGQEAEEWKDRHGDMISCSESKAFLCLSKNQYLLLETTLPFGAERNINQILQHELQRLSPLDEDDVYWDWRIKERDEQKKKLCIELVVVKKSNIDPSIKTLHHHNLFPSAVIVSGHAEKRNVFYRLIPEQYTNKIRRGRLNSVLNAACVLSLIFLAASFWTSLGAQEKWLEIQIAELKPKIVSYTQSKEKLLKLHAITKDFNQFSKTSSHLNMLGELTKALPDSVWVFSVSVEGQNVKVSGFAEKPAGLIEQIDASPLFSNAKFMTQVTTAVGQEGQRFEMSFSVGEGG